MMARLSISLPRPSLDFLAAGTNRRFLLYSVYTTVLFLVFLVVNFPHEVLLERALQSVDLQPLRLHVDSARFAWWRGFELRGVRVFHQDVPLEAPAFEARALYVKPDWAGVLRGRPSRLSVQGTVYNGDLRAQWSRVGGGTRVAIEFFGIHPARHPWLLANLADAVVDGTLAGRINGEMRGYDINELQATAELQGNFDTFNILMVPESHGCVAAATVTLKSGRLDIENARLECEEVKSSISGQIVLREPRPSSYLNLRLDSEPGPKVSENWKPILQVLPCAITGTFASPRFQSCDKAARPKR